VIGIGSAPIIRKIPLWACPDYGVVPRTLDLAKQASQTFFFFINSGVVILSKAIVPRETELKGEVTVGSGTVLHPSAKILALNGPIVIGEGNIIEEKVEIRNR
jgi:NDP-sugar pyrophosphorylase family protein